MYQFILTQFLLGAIDAAKVNSYVPRWITQEQANTIINTPQVTL